MSDESIYNFLISFYLNGRYGFTEDGFNHYLTILKLINNKMFNPLEPESKFITLCAEENWEHAKCVADTRNKEAIEYCDMFRKFIKVIKESSEYLEINRDNKINEILNYQNFDISL